MIGSQSGHRVPYWAIGLLLIVLLVLASYIVARFQIPVDGLGSTLDDGECVITLVTENSPADGAGMLRGDVVLYVDEEPVTMNGHKKILESYRAGDSVTYGFRRNNELMETRLTLVSLWSQNRLFYLAFYTLIFIVCTTSLYILYKKPNDQSARIFFIFLQLFAIAQNQSFLYLDTAYALFATIIFIFGFNLFGVVLLHFYLIFPKPVPFYNKIEKAVKGLYLTGILFGLGLSTLLIWRNYTMTQDSVSVFNEFSHYLLLWMGLTLSWSLFMAIYQFRNAENTHARKQLRLVFIGSLFGLLPPIIYSMFPGFFWRIIQEQNMLSTMEFVNGIGTYIMTSFMAVAIFRYRIWNLEIIFRKAIQYVTATIIIYLLYLTFLSFISILLTETDRITHFVVLAVSILLFLLLRDIVQRYIDKLFYRESYDTAKVVTDFEKKFSGVFQFDTLASGIEAYFSEIFHFKSFLFAIREEGKTYKIIHQSGDHSSQTEKEFTVTKEMDRYLRESRVISIEEIRNLPEYINHFKGEILVPLLNVKQPYGFFLMGEKVNNTSYSYQDIKLLSLLSCRIVSLYYTAKLYHLDLNRQLMLERERTRIARDIHDDVGASLTRISIMSDLLLEKAVDPDSTNIWLKRISETSREVTSDMTQIIWALSPRNDTFEGLSTYVRRFANEYLEPSNISIEFDYPEALNKIGLRAESRRNVFLCIRESLHNIVKHSAAKKVVISFSKEQKWISVKVKDNGNGFNTSVQKAQCNGLINITKRMKGIGGEAKVMASLGHGAEVSLFIPI